MVSGDTFRISRYTCHTTCEVYLRAPPAVNVKQSAMTSDRRATLGAVEDLARDLGEVGDEHRELRPPLSDQEREAARQREQRQRAPSS